MLRERSSTWNSQEPGLKKKKETKQPNKSKQMPLSDHNRHAKSLQLDPNAGPTQSQIRSNDMYGGWLPSSQLESAYQAGRLLDMVSAETTLRVREEEYEFKKHTTN